MLRPAFRRRNTATRVDSHHQRRPFGVDTVHIADLNKRLHREHEQLKGMLRHHTLVSADERERAKHAKSNIPCDGIFAEGHVIAPCVPSTPPRPVRSRVVISSNGNFFVVPLYGSVCWGLYNCLDGYSKYLRTFIT